MRAHNALMVAAGYAPLYSERSFDAPEMTAARAAVEAVLNGHEPFPALAVDRHWNLTMANRSVQALLSGVEPSLLAPPVNVLRLSLHPAGLAPRIKNLAEWRHHLLMRLRAQAEASADPQLTRLYEELNELSPVVDVSETSSASPVAVALQLLHPSTGKLLSFVSATTVFGTATDVTLAELTLECFYPADEATREALLQSRSKL